VFPLHRSYSPIRGISIHKSIKNSPHKLPSILHILTFSKSVNDGFDLPFTKWAYLIYWIMHSCTVTALFHPIHVQGASFLLQCLFQASPSFTLHRITQQHHFWKDKERKYPDWDTWPRGPIKRLYYYYPTKKCTTPLLWLESLLLWVQWKNNQCSRNSFS
jgi:hypothetical protein